MMRAAWLACVCLALLAPLARADEAPAQQSAQSVDAVRLYQLTSELRCPQCQNESLADSNAPVAIDLKNLVREHMQAGESDAQIKQFLVDRYGDFIIYRPPLNASTVALWLGPLLLVLAGLAIVWRNMRGAGQTGEGAEPADAAASQDGDALT